MIYAPQKKLTTEEIASAIIFVNKMGKLSDEALLKRDLQFGEAQKVNHFLSAVHEQQSNLLPEQAVTLMRLLPVLVTKGSQTVHAVILAMGPVVKQMYEQTTELDEKRRLAGVMKTSGMICVGRRLASTSHESRKKELELFESFIGDTKEYKDAVARFNKVRYHGIQLIKEPELVARTNPYGTKYPKFIKREFEKTFPD